MPRGKDVKLRKIGVISSSPKTIVSDENLEFLTMFIDKLDREFRPLITAPSLKEERIADGGAPEGGINKFHPYEVAMLGLSYFRACLQYRQPITKSGLWLFVGMDYRDVKKQVALQSIEQKLLKFVEMYNETALHTRQNPVGAIFALKNMGWSDNMDLNVRPAPMFTDVDREEARKRLSTFTE